MALNILDYNLILVSAIALLLAFFGIFRIRITPFIRLKAIILSEDGKEKLAEFYIPKTIKVFQYGTGKKGMYNIDTIQASKYKDNSIFWENHKYFYTIGNPNPLLLNKKAQPIIDSELYNIQLTNHLARDLNNLSNEGKYDSLKSPILWFIIIGIVAFAIYYSQHKTV